MEELQKITIKKANGEEQEADVMFCFELEKTGKNYIIYTLNEVDSQKMKTFYAAAIKEDENGYKLDNMPDDEWSAVKEVMREIIRDKE